MTTAGACASLEERIVRRELPSEQEPEPQLISGEEVTDAGPGPQLNIDPNALIGLSPSHGPFSGGQTVSVRGNNFGPDVRLWLGDNAATDLIAVSAQRLQATTPPHPPGWVDVIVQNGDDESSRRQLSGAYHYDAFELLPSTGPVVGGTLVRITAPAEWWPASLTEGGPPRVSIDQKACDIVELGVSGEGFAELLCRTPPGTHGSKTVSLQLADGTEQSIVDAFTYADGQETFEGGLSGGVLADQLSVWVLNGFTGERLPGATVLLGADGAQRATTGSDGKAVFEGSLAPSVTITAAMPCFQPITLMDVPVDTATLYLDPRTTADCIPPLEDLLLPGGGGGVPPRKDVLGELVWGFGVEFQRGAWLNVPAPQTEEELRVAYVFELSPSPNGSFVLPSRLNAVTEDSTGSLGYGFVYETRSSSGITLFALAGIEDRSVIPRMFTPYVMGVLPGVTVPTAEQERAYIPMNIRMDHAVTVHAQGPQQSGPQPNRLLANVSLRLGRSGFLLLPELNAEQRLPGTQTLELIGLPPLAGALAGAQYTARLRAVTGPEEGLPWSQIEAVVGGGGTLNAQDAPFLEVPVLSSPKPGELWHDSTLHLEHRGPPADLVVLEARTPSGSRRWRIIGPGQRQILRLPPLATDPVLGLGGGLLELSLSRARIQDFEYASLKERDLNADNWDAHAADQVLAIAE